LTAGQELSFRTPRVFFVNVNHFFNFHFFNINQAPSGALKKWLMLMWFDVEEVATRRPPRGLLLNKFFLTNN
jgi:hypothetical protein